MEVISTHVSSDFDSFSGMIAAKKLFPDAEIIMPSSVNVNVRNFISIHEDNLPELKDIRDIDLKRISKIIIIDTRIASRLGSLKDIIDSRKADVVIFDHHRRNSEDITYGQFFIKDYGATTSIIVELIRKKKINITPLEATLFLLGIFEDTGSFTFPGTTYMDFNMASFLRKKGANLFVISKFLNLSLTGQQHYLLEKLISGVKKININDKEIIFSNAFTDFFVEGLSVLTRKLAQIEDINIVFCWVKMKDKIYVVARSDDVSVDVSRILEVVGGSGHPQAASAIIKNMSFPEIENKITVSLYRNIKKPLLARDIMSSPIKVVDENASISEVYKMLQKYGHSGVPIVDRYKNLVGIITRKDLDRAIKHGLSHAPVKGFKSKGLITTGPGTTVEEVQRLMIENGIGRIPVVQKNDVIGIVTRKDVLRYLHSEKENGFYKNTPDKKNRIINLFSNAGISENLVPLEVLSILKTVSIVSRGLKIKAYLVGGIVRDLLLGIPNLDIDIVVEGDGISFAEKIAEKIDARVESHKKFNTAVVVLKSGQHIDIASARIEYYHKPAALPEVEPGNLNQDLARRDFTINTLAVSLNKNDYGRILDFFGGRKDISQKRIKVLHKLSFIEDPTRIFRAVRFEQRLGFKMDRQTEKLALSSIEMDIVSKLNGIRVRDELITILNEINPWKAVKRLYDLIALKKIGISLIIDSANIHFIKNIYANYKILEKFCPENFHIWRMYLAVLLSGSSETFLRKWCSDLKFRKRDSEVIIDSVLSFERIRNLLSRKVGIYSDLYYMLKGKSFELLVMISAVSKTHFDNVFLYCSRLSSVKLEINGKDLKSLNFKPSKNFKIVFEKLLKLKIDGVINSRQEEMDKARELLFEMEKF